MFFKSAVQVIPFKEFMATKATVGSSYYSASYLLGSDIVQLVDYGSIFFIGLGVVLLGITILEKYGVKINKELVRAVVLVLGISSVLFAILNSSFLTGLRFGW